MTKNHACWIVFTAFNVVFCCVLSFYQTTASASPPIRKPPTAIGQPLADLVRLQSETVDELRAMRALLEKQNELLQRNLGREASEHNTASRAES